MTTAINRWNPVRDMVTVQNMMDRFFAENWRPFFEETRVGVSPLALDVHEDDHSYVVTTDLPGVNPDDIKVHQDGDFLVIEAETHSEFEAQPQEGHRALLKERRFGRYSRRLRLPQTVDFDNSDATYDNGVLRLTLPKAQAPQPRTIQVKASSGSHSNN